MAEADKKARVPPNSKESEMMVLGCMLTSINALNVAADTLNDIDFYYTEHQIVFSALKTAYRADKPADIHLIGEDLKRIGKLDSIGGISYLTTLAQYAGTSAYIEEYVSLVREKAVLRRMINAAQTIEKTALEEPSDVNAALDAAQAQFYQISQTTNQSLGVTIKDLISGVKAESKMPFLKEVQERQQKFIERGPDQPGITGIPTHFLELDKMLNGFMNSNLILLGARPAMGKCVTGDTLILNPETGSLIPIQDLVTKQSGKVATLDSDWKLKSTVPSAYIADGFKPTFKVTTALGKEIEATAVHPLLTIEGWKRIEELKAGDRIAVPRSLPYFGKKEWPEHQLKLLAYYIGDGGLTDGCPEFTNSNPNIVADFKEAAHAFGPIQIRCQETKDRTATYIVSLDRSHSKELKNCFATGLQTLPKEKKKHVARIAKKLGFSPALPCAWAAGGAAPSYEASLALEQEVIELPSLTEWVRENPVTKFLKELGLMGKGSHDKFIPDSVFELKRENIALFINRLFSCDGTAYVANCAGHPFPVVAYASVSKKLISQIQHLLLRFEIISKIRKKKTRCKEKQFSSYELEIHGREDLIRFCTAIGIHGKEEAVAKVLERARSTPSGWSKDTLPIEIWNLLKKKKGERSWQSLFREKNLPPPSNLHAGKRSIRRDTLAKLAFVLNDSELLQMAHSDVYWDRITSIESIGVKEVFDLTIEGSHNFVANDFVVHNTAIALNIAENICFKNKIPVGVFSLEMGADQLLHRVICSQAEVESQKLQTGSLNGSEYQRIVAAVNMMQKHMMIIDDQPGLKITDIRARARRMKEAYNVGFIVIDYLQLIAGTGNNRSQENRQGEISEISRMLKTLARELNIPILCLAQLSRKVEERQGHRPMMSDLRESGCLTGDTLIKNAETGELCTIKELAERKTQTPLQVFAVDENLKMGSHTMTKVFYSGKKKVYELKTRSGRTIKASANHPFLQVDRWTRLDELKTGDHIAIPRSLETDCKESPLAQEEYLFIGHLLGDGCILPNQPYHYTSADPVNIQYVQEASKKLFSINPRVVAQKNWFHVYFPSPYHLTHRKYHPITNWFNKLGIDRVRSYEKKIPPAIFASPIKDRLLFLRHLWATDGNISSKRLQGRKPAGNIYYASSSYNLASQVQHLLLSTGIHSSLRIHDYKPGYKAMYHVQIEGTPNQKSFLNKVGCVGERGKIIPSLLHDLDQIKPNPNNDIIPKTVWKTYIKEAKDRKNLGWREVCKGLNTSYCGSTLFKAGISRERMSTLSRFLEDPFLQKLSESGVYWDEIISIKELGIEDVYDATVPGVHNFVANDIVVHNSLEQDSDVVMFLFRREYYDKHDKPGMAELIVSKNRHGGVGDVLMTFRKEIGQFANYTPMGLQGEPPTGNKGNREAFAAFSPEE